MATKRVQPIAFTEKLVTSLIVSCSKPPVVVSNKDKLWREFFFFFFFFFFLTQPKDFVLAQFPRKMKVVEDETFETP